MRKIANLYVYLIKIEIPYLKYKIDLLIYKIYKIFGGKR